MAIFPSDSTFKRFHVSQHQNQNRIEPVDSPVLIRGSEWGHLDNTKHLIFWLCNMKQLNFKHFNINSKKFTVTVNSSQKDTKTAPKRPKLFCLVYQEVFSHFATIPNHFGRFPKTTEDSRRLPKTTEDV